MAITRCTDCGETINTDVSRYQSLCADCVERFHQRCVPCDAAGKPLVTYDPATL